MPDYPEIARQARLKVLDMTYKAQSSHIGSNFSVIDILTVLFDKMGANDQIVLSAGWKAASLYYFLAKRGDFDEGILDTYNQEGSALIGLTEPGVPGVIFAGGSMQMGVPAAVGFALAKKMKKEPGTIYCIMSDGELAGGMIWESAIIAAAHKLDNLVIIVDKNGLQAMGETKEILPMPELSQRWEAFDWNAYLVDGHNYMDLVEAIEYRVKEPTVIIAETIKGKGVSFMESNNDYHYLNLTEAVYLKARKELFHG